MRASRGPSFLPCPHGAPAPVASRASPRGLGDPLDGRAFLSGPSSPLRVRLLLPGPPSRAPSSSPSPSAPQSALRGPSRSDPLAAPAAERTPPSRQLLPYFPSASRSGILLPGLPICSLKTFSFLFISFSKVHTDHVAPLSENPPSARHSYERRRPLGVALGPP